MVSYLIFYDTLGQIICLHNRRQDINLSKQSILGNTAGEALVRHQDTKIISFTGSTVIGKRIASIAAPMMKRLRYIPKQYISATVIIICEFRYHLISVCYRSYPI